MYLENSPFAAAEMHFDENEKNTDNILDIHQVKQKVLDQGLIDKILDNCEGRWKVILKFFFLYIHDKS